MMQDWSHPAFENPDCAIWNDDEIAAEARAAFDRRRETYPGLIKAGRITVAEARQDTEGWRAIARDWQWIAFGQGTPETTATLDLRITALDTAIARWLDMVIDHGLPPTEEEATQGGLLCAMRWWAEREKPPWMAFHHIRWTSAIGHDWRRENGYPTRGELLAGSSKSPPVKDAA
ncbi:hypothetical protein [Altericroceibacterium endophyticum]|uniref:Uncharacterized protein n=1 Tax=Altericroceibacterium endophyticum TaxID=1808508 RepID=A0A6I4T604_9SPHN|nr:hypothetical protein [Altericroceibacterium endophyticum]MXO66277.1 hypothetical protein [Altericroceibacterium endophyticum]